MISFTTSLSKAYYTEQTFWQSQDAFSPGWSNSTKYLPSVGSRKLLTAFGSSESPERCAKDTTPSAHPPAKRARKDNDNDLIQVNVDSPQGPSKNVGKTMTQTAFYVYLIHTTKKSRVADDIIIAFWITQLLMHLGSEGRTGGSIPVWRARYQRTRTTTYYPV
jgi:hypothetical protein